MLELLNKATSRENCITKFHLFANGKHNTIPMTCPEEYIEEWEEFIKEVEEHKKNLK